MTNNTEIEDLIKLLYVKLNDIEFIIKLLKNKMQEQKEIKKETTGN